MRLVSQTVDPAYAIDGAAFDVVQIVPVRPFEALPEAPVRAIEGIRVKSDFHS